MQLRITTPQFWSMVGLALVGLTDAVFLTIEHYTNANPPCYVGSCETVLTSPYAIILGVPVAVLGVLYYTSVLGGLLWYMSTLRVLALQLVLAATVVGLGMSLYFFSLMAWVIEAWCQYCLLSGAVSVWLFLSSLIVFRQSR